MRPSDRSRHTPMEALEARQLLATFLVDLATDENDGNFAAGDLSLREALVLANDTAEGDSISFSSEIAGQTIGLTLGELLVAGDTLIRGYDEDGEDASITIDGNGLGRIFNINDSDGSGTSDVTIENLTLVNANSGGDDGGAIFSTESLTIRSTVIGDSTAGAGFGGGIYHTAFDGTLTIVDSAIRNNTAERGAGVYVISSASVFIDSSEIAGNTAARFGGGIQVNSLGGDFTLRNSTISGNAAASDGGGLLVDNPGNAIIIRNSTVAFNVADSDTSGGGSGAGVRIEGGTLTLTSTIVSDNTLGGGAASDIVAEVNTVDVDGSTNNLIGHAGSAGGLSDGVDGNLVGRDPQLVVLDANDGQTRTHALGEDSPAIDAGSNPAGLAFDQRGEGFARSVGEGVDIGAFELQFTELDLEALADSLPRGTSNDADTHWVVVRNGDGDLIVFTGTGDDWQAFRLRDRVTDAPAAISDAVIYTDPADGLTYIAVPSDDGFLLYQRGAAGQWTYRNLTDELGISESTPIDRLTQFTTVEGLVSIGGYTADDDLVLLQQTGDTLPEGREWSFRNLSDDLRSRNMATPNLTDIISYVTPWDQWTIAGIDDQGDIQGIWVFTPAFETWRVDNLSDLYGAPTLVGQLTVIQTSWQAINLAGTDENGHLVVTWWVPRFRVEGRGWAVNDLTSQFDGEPLVNGRITGFVTPWGAMNYAGLNEDGEVVAYWWVPNRQWAVSSLTRNETPDAPRPTGTLTNHVSDAGTMSILGASEENHVVRLWWTVDSDGWELTDLTEIAVRT